MSSNHQERDVIVDLLAHPRPLPSALVDAIVDAVATEPMYTRVSLLAHRPEITTQQLKRLFDLCLELELNGPRHGRAYSIGRLVAVAYAHRLPPGTELEELIERIAVETAHVGSSSRRLTANELLNTVTSIITVEQEQYLLSCPNMVAVVAVMSHTRWGNRAAALRHIATQLPNPHLDGPAREFVMSRVRRVLRDLRNRHSYLGEQAMLAFTDHAVLSGLEAGGNISTLTPAEARHLLRVVVMPALDAGTADPEAVRVFVTKRARDLPTQDITAVADHPAMAEFAAEVRQARDRDRPDSDLLQMVGHGSGQEVAIEALLSELEAAQVDWDAALVVLQTTQGASGHLTVAQVRDLVTAVLTH